MNRRTAQLKRIVIVLIFVLGVSIGAIPGAAQSRVECSKIESKYLKRAVPYCAMLPASFDQEKSRKFPIIYFLHGLGDNEQSMINAGGWSIYEDLLAKKKVGEFVVAAPYGYQSFYVNSKDGKMQYENFFLREFMPEMEKRYRFKGGRNSRGIMGVSMGGYGALHYAFKYPQKFVAVSTHMAALQDSVDSNVGNSLEGQLLTAVFGNPIDKAYYKANNPLQLARTASVAQLRTMKIYFDCGDRDNYGFNVGAEQLHAILQKRRVPHEWHIYPGGHDWEYVLRHFDASLIWQSRALGLTK